MRYTTLAWLWHALHRVPCPKNAFLLSDTPCPILVLVVKLVKILITWKQFTFSKNIRQYDITIHIHWACVVNEPMLICWCFKG